ncbi:N-terminal nucleophile aminohydrolases (Ntn hydrolases) [Glarea lozoyensis ATCC 20868]|uniref:N-terminal nucleophile aminohydrolases (Ntn hydrolases) n=1 Tax=Glarea lozoyensis (strain ATCC 20868 / MF5171) TaxID=1116229 RepID=S3DAQ5_GLAL2|nr:N-terminal nucleophile aminohydrolases (Ntn hydrolases) [Glarea lozoyensis ATCC 20868]EPE34770.1 N-terminal nucleophile aminohydrolases (Ntn hydrolases) [Glarea lozoyensis ATCC 20868]
MEHPSIKTIKCTGTPYEIGFTHGSTAVEEVLSNIKTYTSFFQETAQLTWKQARNRASEQFIPVLKTKYPSILEEMRGIAEGSGHGLLLEDILALNVRSEIALTNYADGCTTLAQAGPEGKIFLAQNWDWIEQLRDGMVILHIQPPTGQGYETKILSEAGIVGKVGMNRAGVGLCLNALRSGALDISGLPIHCMSRRILQYAGSVDEALSMIAEFSIASTGNYVVADRTGDFLDIEYSPHGNVIMRASAEANYGYVAHTNHLCGPDRPAQLKDHPAANSFSRLKRFRELTDADNRDNREPSFQSIRKRLSDEEGFPYSICRERPSGAVGMERMTTLCTIIMEMKSLTGVLTIGRPCKDLIPIKWSF